MQTNREMALEICKEYITLTPEQRIEFLDLFTDYMRGRIPEQDIENLEVLRNEEQRHVKNKNH